MEIHLARTWLADRLHRLPRRNGEGRVDDRGSDIVQTVIIVGLFAAAAILIVGILISKATDAANAVKTQ
ncbi:MAG TPA: hypothetical protein VFP72_16495 [Kineosporiaceae bacterium]|nr:hypothetical protein [Kineosporiaceae bacterium]